MSPERKWLRGLGVRTMLSVVSLASASTVDAELVVMTDGQVLKVESFEHHDGKVLLGLRDGGRLTLSIDRVSRILEDEIVEDPSKPEIYPVGNLALWFDRSQEVPDTPFGDLIYETSRRHRINPTVVAAMVRAESAFDPRAISPKGAMGLLQLMPATATRFGLERRQAFEPDLNLDAGVRYIKWLGERFEGDLVLVLAGYNAGEAMVERYDGVPPFRETDGYIRRVVEFADGSSAGR